MYDNVLCLYFAIFSCIFKIFAQQRFATAHVKLAVIVRQTCYHKIASPFSYFVTLLLLPKIVNYHLAMKLIANTLLYKRISLAFPDVLKT